MFSVKRDARTIYLSKEDEQALSIIMDILKFNCKEHKIYINGAYDYYKDTFYEYKDYTLKEIMEIIKLYNDNSISKQVKERLLDIKKLQDYLMLLSIKGLIVINYGINECNSYRRVPVSLVNSVYTRNYYKININNPKKILLISDTHIGNEKVEDFNLINKVFKYAEEEHGIDTAIHLGDVFEGIRLDKGRYSGLSMDSPEVKQIIENQLEKFKKYFPENLKVIAIEGNHDNNILKYLNQMNYLGYPLNQHYLTAIKPNFYMLKERNNGYIIELGDLRIALSHPLQFNLFIPYVKTFEVYGNDHFLELFKKYNIDNIDLIISGHFHYSLNYMLEDYNQETRRIIEVVPSLSKISQETKDKFISNILRFIYNDLGKITHYGITPLYLLEDKITEGKERIYPINKELQESNQIRF